MAYIDKIKYNGSSGTVYNLLDSGATHDSNYKLSGTTGNFKANGTIVAEQGIFNKLIATSANISTLDVNSLTAQNATVVGLLDVQGQLKTNSWTNSNIATIEGNFFIAPTLSVSSSTFTIANQTTVNAESTMSSKTGQSKKGWVVTISGNFNLNQIGAEPVDDNDTILNQWSQGSKVLITGDIEKSNGVYPLGTLTGYIYSSTTSSGTTEGSMTIYNVTDNLGNTDIFTILAAGSYTYRNIKISLTQRYYSGFRPIGILMSAQGRASKSFIDIYGGANILQASNLDPQASTNNTSDYGGLALPNVRIGNLRGLPNIRTGDFTNNNALPTGWGIYTQNGYFKGTIVSTYGEIGGFSISDLNLHNGSLGEEGSVWISVGDEETTPTSVGGSGEISNWAFTSGSKFGVDTEGNLYATGGRIGSEDSYISIGDSIEIVGTNLSLQIEDVNNKLRTQIDQTADNFLFKTVRVALDNNYNYQLTDQTVEEIDGSKTYYIFNLDHWEVVENPVITDIANYYERGDIVRPEDEVVAEVLVGTFIKVAPEGVTIDSDKITFNGYSFNEAVNTSITNITDGIQADLSSKIDRQSGSSSMTWCGGALSIESKGIDNYATVIGGDGIEFVYGYEDLFEFALTSDQAIDPNKHYYILNNGNYELIANPIASGLSSYYEQRFSNSYKNNVVASINQDKLDIRKTVVLDQMELGRNKWAWKYNDTDDSIVLKWIGG